MYEVVLGVDTNEERAQAQAKTIATLPQDPENLHATILHNFTDNPTGASVHQIGAVRHAKEELEETGIDVTLTESSGDPATEIINTADEIDADMICVTGRKRTPTGKVLFGSVTQAVILATDRPVLVCGAADAG